MFKRLITYCLLFCLPSFAAAKIVFNSGRDGNSNIYVMDDDGSNVQRLTFTQDPQADGRPVWSPDGTCIAFVRDTHDGVRDQKYEVFLMHPDGSNVQQLTNDGKSKSTGTWSPDGHHLAFTTYNNGYEIYVMDILTREVVQLTHNPGERDGASYPSWSPNGKYIAYVQRINLGRENNRTTLYVMNADGTEANELIRHVKWVGRTEPHWGPDSRSVLYSETRYALVDGFSKAMESRVVIQKYGSKVRRILKTPENWFIHGVCWMDNGRKVLISAREGEQEDFEIHQYHLATEQITNLTNHPANDISMDWISDDVLSVTPRGKISLKWAELKK